MAVTQDTIKYVAKLSMLNLSEQEIDLFAGQIDDIVKFVDTMDKLDTSSVPETAHILPVSNVFREDVVEKKYSREEVMANAPDSESGCFKVPKFVE